MTFFRFASRVAFRYRQLRKSGGRLGGRWHGLCNTSGMQGRMPIVDDEKSIQFALSDYLGTLGYEVDCAKPKPAGAAPTPC